MLIILIDVFTGNQIDRPPAKTHTDMGKSGRRKWNCSTSSLRDNRWQFKIRAILIKRITKVETHRKSKYAHAFFRRSVKVYSAQEHFIFFCLNSFHDQVKCFSFSHFEHWMRSIELWLLYVFELMWDFSGVQSTKSKQRKMTLSKRIDFVCRWLWWWNDNWFRWLLTFVQTQNSHWR